MGGGILLFYLDKIDNIEPLFSISGFVYWSLLFYWAARWAIRQRRSILKLKTEKEKTELLHLQNQVNPHFFFNMLNNLYDWVGKDPEKAQALILKFSDMMRYSIYDGQKDFVALDEEITYLENYIELHKMRYHNKINVQFNTEIAANSIKIVPLLFIMLLENAFKHGVESLGDNAYVTSKLFSTGTTITFEVENNFNPDEVSGEPGIGLKNLKRRLELVCPKKHNLLFSINKAVYKTSLTLKYDD